jgi:NAD(P)-dependent dehydrogenase (short-subunit alcohol dehydrogenase family)
MPKLAIEIAILFAGRGVSDSIAHRAIYNCERLVSHRVASKHAVMGLTRAAALDYAKQGIRINAVNPGSIATELMARSADQMGITFDDIGAMVPMGRIGQAAEIAQAVVFLCSDAASYITGQPLVVDGGFTAS